MVIENHWYLVSSHGSILFYIAVYPDCTIKEIAEAMSLTRRTVWGVIGNLRREGMLHVRKEGRRHHYSVNMDGPFKHPVLNGLSLRLVLGNMVEQRYIEAQGRGWGAENSLAVARLQEEKAGTPIRDPS